MVNAQYNASGRGKIVDGDLHAGGHFEAPPAGASVLAEFPKMVGGLIVRDAAEERLICTAPDDMPADELRAKLQDYRQERAAEAATAHGRWGDYAAGGWTDSEEYPKHVPTPAGVVVVRDAAEERAVLSQAPVPISYIPSVAARQAIVEARAEGESESDVIDKAILAWARWRKSAMKPGQRPIRKADTAASAGA